MPYLEPRASCLEPFHSSTTKNPVPASTAVPSAIEHLTMRKIMRRLMPLMALMFLVNFLDRVNLSFAALTMNEDLGLSSLPYAWGAGIFFIAYFVFEVPSNLIMERVGARLWMTRIMLSWGLVSASMALVQ